VNNVTLYAVGRESGNVLWSYDLPGSLTQPPVADENSLYLCTAGRRVFAFRFPAVDLGGKQTSAIPAQPGYGGPSAGKFDVPALSRGRPVALWIAPSRGPVDLPPVLGPDVVLLTSPDGKAQALAKRSFDNVNTTERFSWSADGDVAAPP